MSIDPFGNRPVESSAWIERMVWRTVFMVLFVFGLIAFVYSGGTWLYLAFVLGGLIPGLFLMAREQSERHIEAQRRLMAPEPRHDVLPEIGGSSRPHAPLARGYHAQRHGEDYPTAREPVPYGGRPYDDDEPLVELGLLNEDTDDGTGPAPLGPH